ncbi:aminoglycoside phosphotransferase family protein [Kitasatospora sp. NPDC088346]|uniref:aminoglycoside phosphotransferase family protein n=1 Tax=Kitasatospora sp. NPDC088346 TaxID=3364073 RepID=UPI0037FACA03
MHADEVLVPGSVVRRLLRTQFPHWAALPLDRVEAGTSNAMFRLGKDLVVRLPRTPGAAEDVAKEHHWLPRLAPRLPVAVPVPLGGGTPGAGYPWPWSVYRWLDGENPTPGHTARPELLAADLAAFVGALRRTDPVGGPPSYRAERLATRDAGTRAAIAKVRGLVDTDAVTDAWEAALRAPAHAGPPGWIHGDLQPGNLLTAGGRLSAVIDFGCLGLGDPAVDLIAAWYVLPAGARSAFRTATADDDAHWARGRGWALSIALDELWYYRETGPAMAAVARHVIEQILTDHALAG